MFDCILVNKQIHKNKGKIDCEHLAVQKCQTASQLVKIYR